MTELERRRIDRLNKEYAGMDKYDVAMHRKPVFSSRRLFWMTVVCFIGVAMIAWRLL